MNSSVVTESSGYDHVVAPMRSPNTQSDFVVLGCSLWQETQAGAEAKSGNMLTCSPVVGSMKCRGFKSVRMALNSWAWNSSNALDDSIGKSEPKKSCKGTSPMEISMATPRRKRAGRGPAMTSSSAQASSNLSPWAFPLPTISFVNKVRVRSFSNASIVSASSVDRVWRSEPPAPRASGAVANKYTMRDAPPSAVNVQNLMGREMRFISGEWRG